jgi:hypothetical protein
MAPPHDQSPLCKENPMKSHLSLLVLLVLGMFVTGCATDKPLAKKTSAMANETVSTIQLVSTDVSAAKETVDSMTTDNLQTTKPVAQVHLSNAQAGLIAAGASAIKTQESAVKDEKSLASYRSNDPMKTKLEWLAGICAVIGVAGLGAGIAGSVLSISFIAGDIKKLCFAIGGAGVVLAIGLGWLVTHWVQIQAGLTIAIITGVVGFVVYVFVMHGSAKDGAWAFVGAIEAFFVGLWDDFRGWGRAATAIVTGKTGETTLIPPNSATPTVNPPITNTPAATTTTNTGT